jgi:ketosteroid isomerase-like protein
VPESRRERIEAVYRRWVDGDFSAGGELFADDVSFEPISDGRGTVGRDAIDDFMREFLAQWDDFRVEAVEITERGDSIVVTERQRATGKASGIATEQTSYATWSFRGNEVVRVRWTLERPD